MFPCFPELNPDFSQDPRSLWSQGLLKMLFVEMWVTKDIDRPTALVVVEGLWKAMSKENTMEFTTFPMRVMVRRKWRSHSF